MKSRRDFLKEAATGAVVLGCAADALGLAGMLDQHAASRQIQSGDCRDPALHGQSAQPDEKRVLDLLDRAIATYTGRDNPVEAWKHIVARVAAGQGDRPQDERPGRQGNFDSPGAGAGHC